ncbi:MULTISPECIES: LysE family translocator [unclassified Variovorax]|uniref:LysE family translocator n=1 Tax=unclassified Variovorax TaxID=663243 RepID=UPI0032E680B5
MTLSAYLLFLPACFAINMAFGPNNLLSVTNGAKHGVSPAVIAASGRLVAFAVMIAIAGLGMGAVLVASELAFDVIKYIGAAYLVWIGVRLLRAPAPTAQVQAHEAAPPSMRALVRQEFTVAAGNPKAILVFELVAIALYALLGARMRRLANGSRAMRWFNRVSGSMMVGFGLVLAFTRRPA